MIITTITVSAARTFNHPTERFANFRHEITLAATLTEDDNSAGWEACHTTLRKTAEGIAEQHKADILHDLKLESERKAAQWNLASARGWEEQLQIHNTHANEYRANLDLCEKWDELTELERQNLGGLAGIYMGQQKETVRAVLEKMLAGCLLAAAKIQREGPQRVAEKEAALAALPKPRLLPEVLAAAKEIHPGHPDHPATDADNDE